MKKLLCSLLAFLFIVNIPLWAGLGSDKAMYVGGTVSAIPQKTEGKLNTDDSKMASFDWKKGAPWQLPYDKVTSLAYGQHAGRRVGATIAWGVTTFGIMALPMLLSKKRRHYLTLEYVDSTGASQAAIFELGKDAIRTTLKSMEVRTGKKIEYEDDEARKSGNK
jgi:hypothetical protein